MDTSQLLVTVGGVALIAGNLWFFFGKKATIKPVAKAPQYACPMHPWITSDDPTADCSICGMKLVKSEEMGK